VLSPIFTAIFYHWHGAILVTILSALIVYKHVPNIQRLREGTEPRIGKKT
jgi:glycerol-3-phosphate acyltransferase PlsY